MRALVSGPLTARLASSPAAVRAVASAPPTVVPGQLASYGARLARTPRGAAWAQRVFVSQGVVIGGSFGTKTTLQDTKTATVPGPHRRPGLKDLLFEKP